MTTFTTETYKQLEDADLLKYGSFAVYELLRGDFNQEYTRKETATRTTPAVFKDLLNPVDGQSKQAFIEQLNSNYIIYGLNWADAGSTEYGELSDFHYVKERDVTTGKSPRANTKIVGLAKSVFNTPIANSFISDIVKGFPQTDSSKITRKSISQNKEVLNVSLEKMQQELDIIKPKGLIFLHSRCEEIFTLFKEQGLVVPEGLKTITIYHYSGYTKNFMSLNRKKIFCFTDAIEHHHLIDPFDSLYSVMNKSR